MTITGNDKELAVLASLVGRTIVAAEFVDACRGANNWGDDGWFLLTLDDGRLIEFGAWGHDAWGPTIGEVDE